mmetsp:Transcript_2366/g.4843  ORF Transcript_2366/g.4843 Transcript_2366/m.4843 type:complete len:776 (+) Transcript_2366:229-2556(+)|eukprot:CAMPEP_0168746684 /NCGR_PEP_ID=MMETSP0724-20121128/15276_1 /TAXON_ID=265536 /ORGANISM="Amphiprora sp., Strain CCMP467" /LENGTH=775 /DNA_ID=CAMNT_0008794467 /DNA_START=169 /DNA_END=2496 /DNA_ORIENTATION=+
MSPSTVAAATSSVEIMSSSASDSSFWSTILDTLVASIHSVGTACTLAAVGTYMHQRGFISAPGKKMLALISQQVTFPLFLFTKIIYCKPHQGENGEQEACPDVTESLRQVWMLLVWPLFVVGVGLWIGYMVSYITGAPLHQRKSVMAAIGFGNSTGLPITLLTVVHTNFSKRNRDSELGRVDPTLFLSVYLLLYPVLQWGLGGWLLAPDESKSKQKKQEESNGNRDVEAPAISASPAVLTEPALAMQAAQYNHEYQPSYAKSMLYDASASPSQTAASSYWLRNNVLNNKGADEYFIRHRQGLYSSDEGLYMSDFNLNALGRTDSFASAASQNFGAFGRTDSFASASGPFGSRTSLLLGSTSQQSLAGNNNNSSSNNTPSYLTAAAVEDRPRYVTRTLGGAPSSVSIQEAAPLPDGELGTGGNASSDDEAPEFLLYDSPDPTATEGSSSKADLSSQEASAGDDSKDTNGNKSIPDDTLDNDNEKVPLLDKEDPVESTVRMDNRSNDSSKQNNYGSTTAAENRAERSQKSNNNKSNPLKQWIRKRHKRSFSFSEYEAVDSIWTTLRNISERCLQPPVIGAITGILVAISPARGWFVDMGVDEQGNDPAPAFEWFYDGLYSVGLTAVPINMIILGCNLSNSYNKFIATRGGGAKKKNDDSRQMDGTSTNDSGIFGMVTMVGIVIGKMIVMPIVGFLSVWILQTFVLDIPDSIDAPFYLVLLIVFLTPTANNVMVMVELSGSNTKEGIANVIALQYAVAPIILSCTVAIAIGYALTFQH